jgi:Kdo2-lipid IVA lauroyltransferase/acyltransferase
VVETSGQPIPAGAPGQPGGTRATDPGVLDAGPLTRLEYWGFLAIAGLARAMPLDLASTVSGRLWRAIAPWLRRHKRAQANLQVSMPSLSADQQEAILAEMWEVLGRTVAEAFHLDDIAADADRVRVELSPEVKAIFSCGTGCVLASMHSGNWELAALAAARSGLQVAGVYQKIKNPLVDRAVTGMRAHFYPLGLFSKGHDTVMKLMRIVRGGGSLAVMADLREHKGIDAPFFGRPAPSTPFPALMARAIGVPLVAGRVLRTDGARFVVTAEIVPVPRTHDRDADVRQATEALQAVFERWIREAPGQWMWGHRRWAR